VYIDTIHAVNYIKGDNNMRKKTGIMRICKTCKKEFYVQESRLKTKIYCSRKCCHTGIMKKCARCKKKFYVVKSLIKTAKYCSRKCVRYRITKICVICKRNFVVRMVRKQTAKYCSYKCAGKSRIQKLCIRGHNRMGNISLDRSCEECRRERVRKRYIPHPKQPVQFCPKGHDTFICGRDKGLHGNCNDCDRDYESKRRKNDVYYLLVCNLRNRLRTAIKRGYKAGSAVRDLGCTIKFFKTYTEKKFYGRMTWKNWGPYWELDHIKALCLFDLSDRKQFLKAFNYKNMQPLTIPDHDKKTVKDLKKLSNLQRRRI
jgi:hypothetical protein